MARILAIHAHPDDVEILAGGTLALLADRGHAITVATLTPGDCGSHEYGPEEIASIRRREAAAAAARIGAAYLCLEFRDLAIFNDDAGRRRVTEALRQARAEIVLTASPVDYHCDHEAASVLVRDACFAAPAPNYRTASPAIDAIPHLYFIDPVEGCDREGNPIRPDFVVNVAGPRGESDPAGFCSERGRRFRAEARDAERARQPAELATEAAWDSGLPGTDGGVDAEAGGAGGLFARGGVPAVPRAPVSAVAAARGVAGGQHRVSHANGPTDCPLLKADSL